MSSNMQRCRTVEDSEKSQIFQEILSGCGGNSVGAYSQSTGVDIIRKHVAEYIQVDNFILSFLCFKDSTKMILFKPQVGLIRVLEVFIYRY